MNNLTFGSSDYGYYETIGGGAGATRSARGASGVQTHMTNTRITDPEVVESRFAVRLVSFAFRKGSGGDGTHEGGDGLIRCFEALEPLTVSILSDRRSSGAPGLAGGQPGEVGRNWFAGKQVGPRHSGRLEPGQRVTIETPGGGGYGPPDKAT